MLPFFWRSGNRFSLQEFRYQINRLRDIRVVDVLNTDLVADILRSIVEIVTYGDQHDPAIFECFMEHQILAEFLRLLMTSSRDSGIEAQLLYYLNIMIQNLDNEQSIYFCFSNEYVNNIILHQFNFTKGDLALYYVSFLRTISGKLNKDTIYLLVKVHKDEVVSFPLYSEALKFAWHEEKMIRITVRALTLSIYNVCDDMVYAFITRPPATDYFSDLVLNMKQQCLHLDDLVSAMTDNYTDTLRMDLLVEADKFIDDLYYCKDILRVCEPRLSKLVTHNLLSLLVLPLLLPLLHSFETNALPISAITSLYIVSRLLQIVDEKDLMNSVAAVIVLSYTEFSTRNNDLLSQIDPSISSFELLNELKGHLTVVPSSETGKAEKVDMKFLSVDSLGYSSVAFHAGKLEMDDIQNERLGILKLIFSNNHILMLAALMLLFVLFESKELDDSFLSFMGFLQKKFAVHKILHELLKLLSSQPTLSAPRMWCIGWTIRKLLPLHEKRLSEHDQDGFNKSYDNSYKNLLQEINGCWFDYIPDTMKNEWETCRRALDESSQSKDPIFSLEPPSCREIPHGDMSSSLAWQKMVYTVQVFVLHHLLKAFILTGDFPDNPLSNLQGSSTSTSRTHSFDAHFLTSRTELGSGSSIPCKISFVRGEERDILLIPKAKGILGKLFLVERLMDQSPGVVIAVASLAGLNPLIDENQSTWLHLRIRDYDPQIEARKFGRHQASPFNSHTMDPRWTLGFARSEACEAAQSTILREISKQRSSVESLLSPFLMHSEILSSGSEDDGKQE